MSHAVIALVAVAADVVAVAPITVSTDEVASAVAPRRAARVDTGSAVRAYVTGRKDTCHNFELHVVAQLHETVLVLTLSCRSNLRTRTCFRSNHRCMYNDKLNRLAD